MFFYFMALRRLRGGLSAVPAGHSDAGPPHGISKLLSVSSLTVARMARCKNPIG
jgi:ABC-type arginine transport system permease subunit